MSEVMVPGVVTQMNGREQSVNPISYALQKHRTIYLNGEVTDFSALNVITQMQYLNDQSDQDITLIINSPGGSVTAGMAIFDCIKYGISCDVVTVAAGMAASMGAFLLAAGTKGKRYATPNAEIMIHQPLGGAQGQATDINLIAEHIQKTKKKLASILAEESGRSLKKVLADTERDYWMSSEEAMKYGLIDHVGIPGMEVEYDN